MFRRTTRYKTLRKIKISTYLTAEQEQSHGDADDKAQPPLCITVPQSNTDHPKYGALQTLNPPKLLNTRTNYRPSQNKSCRQFKRLGELFSIPPMSNSVSLVSNSDSLIILSSRTI